MSPTLIWSVVAGLAVVLIGVVVWLARRPFPEIAVSEETWMAFNGPHYYAWSEANPGDGRFMVQRRDDGDYHMTFMSRAAARRFRERWLAGVPNQAALTRESHGGTGPNGN